MKTSLFIVMLLASTIMRMEAAVTPATPEQAQAPVNGDKTGLPAPTAYAVTKRDANSRVWERTTYEKSPSGQIVSKKHSYTELATGLHYLKDGQWIESKEEIEILPNGTAQAVQGQHRAFFPGNIFNGVIEVVTPDGKHLKSRPIGLSYFDGKNSVLIAELTNSVGVVAGSNQVIYPNAFTDFGAILSYKYTKSGFEQEVVFQEQPPAPEQFGLSSENSRLQLLTEFFDTDDPTQTATPANQRDGLQDKVLTFGQMKMIQGKAFSIGDQETTRTKGTPVYKSWQHLEGRTFLVEELPYLKINAQLEQLPVPASATVNLSSASPVRHKVSGRRLLPPVRLVQAGTNAIQLARAESNYKSGVVLDYYATINADNTNFTFQTGTTYYINGGAHLSGTTIFQGGAVLKFSEAYGGLGLDDFICQATADQPIIFTSVNDNSVGETISLSTGSPGSVNGGFIWKIPYNWNAYGTNSLYQHMRFYYGGWSDSGCECTGNGAIYDEYFTADDVQFINCGYAIDTGAGNWNAAPDVILNNVLFANCGLCIGPDSDGFQGPAVVYGNNVTMDNSILGGWDYYDGNYFCFTNSIFSRSDFVPVPPEMNGNYNGFYDISRAGIFGSNSVTSTRNPFTNAAATHYYLIATNAFHNAGTTNINPALLAELQTMTTYAPQNGGYADTNTPDLGYHYPINEDSDYDGLPDWWEWKYFGSYAHSGTNLDSYGRSLLYDYTNNITPAFYSFNLTVAPLSQEVFDSDTVTFSVDTGGNTNLTFQWTFNDNPIEGATINTYTINRVMDSDAGEYACIISDRTNTLVTPAAQLTVDGFSGDVAFMPIVSDRQDYTFKSGITYYIGQPIQLYGNTTIEGGAVLKFDWNFNSTLLINGTLTCKGEPYYPAILTSVDDDSYGEQLIDPNSFYPYSYEDGPPQPYQTGVPYLDLTSAKNNFISNVRIGYADWGVTTPVLSRKLDAWDCQFVNCNYGIVDVVNGHSTNSLHNVLFANCSAAVGASTNTIDIEAEQVTADVDDFCLADATPNRIALTNSVIWGGVPTAASFLHIAVALNPDNTNFVSSGAGDFYLAANSPLHHTGAANISSRLLNELKNKTTYAPIAIPDFYTLTGEMTFAPQAQRYTNGAPDVGYYYDPLDYTVADMILQGGRLTILPGTAIGYRMDYNTQVTKWTLIGFDVKQSSSIISQGTPNKPNVFADVQCVQEQSKLPVWIGIVPDYFPTDESSQPPLLNFRFSDFYLNYDYYTAMPANHFMSGMDTTYQYEQSFNSVMNFNLQDCTVHGGQINIGVPDANYYDPSTIWGSGAVTWVNNSFDDVAIDVEPTFYEVGYSMGVDLIFSAYNNLFHGGRWFHLQPIPASAGNWTLNDNLFDGVDIIQGTVEVTGVDQPLNFSNNGYWPLSANDLAIAWDLRFSPWGWPNSAELLPTDTSDGSHEVTLNNPPPYQSGAFGKFYLPDTTPLYQAGSRTVGDAGFAQYTTWTNQTKVDKDSTVNIGLHYVTASSNGQPLDTDGDGISDNVEDANGNGQLDNGETSISTATTVSGVLDVTNSVYDDVDLSGNGLVGRIKKALGLNPLDPNSPLTLKRVITGEEPDIATFEVPVSYSTMTNIGLLSLSVDGIEAAFNELDPATNGNCLLKWNTTYDSPTNHYLSARIMVGGDSLPDSAILFGQNGISLFNSTNVLQFFQSDTMFDDGGAFLDAQLPCPDAIYTIQLFDPSTTPPTLIRTITNSVSDGMIQEDWDLTYDDGVTVFTNDTVTAVFNVTLLDPAQGTHTKTLHKLSSNEQGNEFDFLYFYTPTNSSLTYDFGNPAGQVWLGMQGIVDTLLMPVTASGGHDNHYDSSFNNYTYEGNNTHGNGLSQGWPGYANSRSTITNSSNGLYLTMTNGATKNFYGYGHGTIGNKGSGKYLGSYNYSENAYIGSAEIGNLLDNHFNTKGGLWTKNPYRFVFMDGCATMDTKDWRRAFGIFPMDTPNQAAKNKVGAQAFIGWEKEHAGNYATADLAKAYTDTLDKFYEDWMNNTPLAACIQDASDSKNNKCPFPVPGNELVKDINGNQFRGQTSKVFISGHTGLTRGGLRTDWENYKPYTPPPGNE